MRIRRDRRLALLAWGLPATAVIAISFGLTIRQAGFARTAEPARFSGSRAVLDMPSLLASPRLPARLRVAVIRDEAAADFYDTPATLDSIVAAWREALAAVGADASVVRSSELHRARDARVLVIPSSPCLSVATREAIERAGGRGQGLIVTGPIGTHDAGCRRIGYGLLVALTGAARAEVLEDRAMVYVVVPADGPLAADVPPGARIDVHPAAQLALRGSPRDAVYTRYDGRPAPAGDSPLLDAALTRGSHRGARVVHWGFELRDVLDRPWDRAILALLVRNAVAWAGALPLPTVESWPDGRRAAVVIAQDVEAGFANARFAADSLRAIGVPSTFFLTTRIALSNRRLTRALLRTGEVGSHSEHHGLLGGLPAGEQEARLHATQADLARLAGAPVAGLRPPEEQFDAATMRAWLAAGGRYLLGANDGRATAPELIPVGADTLILLSRTGPDDFAAMRRAAGDVRAAEALIRDEFRHVRGLGGLHAFSYHSQLLARPENVPTMARLARAFARDTTVWIATAGEVAGWWLARARLETAVRRVAADRLELTVRNPGPAAVRGAVVRITLPPSRRVVLQHGEPLPSEPEITRVPVPPVEAGEVWKLWVRLEP